MDKLTTEQKAKAYDEALERANKLKETCDSNAVVGWMEYIFPELKESEDEKVCKEIKQFIRSRGMQLAQSKVESWIAWLEKQGGLTDIPADAVLDGNKDGLIADTINAKGEQKPAEWTAEDEDNFKHLIDEIVCLGNSRNSANRLYYDKLIKFLHELKNRAQPREEWRDKDERMLDRLIAYFEKRVAFTDEDNSRYANWLKSLRPKSTWKPSDEQMNTLWDAIVYVEGCNSNFKGSGSVLEKLYNDLKKLKRIKL